MIPFLNLAVAIICFVALGFHLASGNLVEAMLNGAAGTANAIVVALNLEV